MASNEDDLNITTQLSIDICEFSFPELSQGSTHPPEAQSGPSSIEPTPIQSPPTHRLPLSSPNAQDIEKTSSRKNHVWSAKDIIKLITLICDNENYQHALLPARSGAQREHASIVRKEAIYCEIFKNIFPGIPVDHIRIKTKVCWLCDTYTKEHKRLLLTGAGLQEGVDPSSLAYTNLQLLKAKYPWFKIMHHMMTDHHPSGLAVLLTTPSINVPSDSKNAENQNLESASEAMDVSGDEVLDHGPHSRGLQDLATLVDASNNLAGPSVNVGDVSEPQTPSPVLQRHISNSSDVFGPTPSPASHISTPSTKRKRSSTDTRCDTLANTFYQSTVDGWKLKVQVEAERTKWSNFRETEHTKRQEMCLAQAKEKEAEDRKLILKMVCMLASHGDTIGGSPQLSNLPGPSTGSGTGQT